ncbi:MAG: hypothetical protein L0Y66_05285 [Myxococcaceae bacterium]|nr:hypothetical protein [Myxococcaceae bacterium]
MEGTTYGLADIERHARQLTGHDFRAFFAQTVESEGFFDIPPPWARSGFGWTRSSRRRS